MEILIGANPTNPEVVGTLHKDPEQRATQLPDPMGYRMLVAIPDAEKTFDGSLLEKADSTIYREEVLSTVFFVIKMG